MASTQQNEAVTANRLLVTDTQQQKAAARRKLPAGQRQR
jgi:hypothetical protein